MSELTYVTATMIARDGMESDLEKVLVGVLADVRAEDGCLRYDLHKSDDGNTFLFYEIWQSMAALAAHGNTPHMKAMQDAAADLVAGPAKVNTWQVVAVV
ncbi:MAG: antibiotic biosynthesis monooxygenase [Pseudodesulfovibrio sp.]|nr:antibiotic biosynthesis monooxygenase [Pseudodesulfovibrio sp.]